jgi:pimeloyl-ACP methyl ester carboxylesterase
LPPGRFVDLPGRGRTFVREVAGPRGAAVLVLLHGLGATADLNWATSYAALGRSFRVLAPDLRGHGRGIRSARRFRLEDCADDAAALADALGVERFVAVGYSMGGPVAQLAWRRHRERVAGLVLCATSRHFSARTQQLLFSSVASAGQLALRFAPRGLPRAVATNLLAGRLPDSPLREWAAEELALANPRAVFEAGLAVGAFSSHAWVGEIDVPTAVVVTADDSLVAPSRQLKLAQAIPGAHVFPVPLDHTAPSRPRVFVPALVEACRDVAQRARLTP